MVKRSPEKIHILEFVAHQGVNALPNSVNTFHLVDQKVTQRIGPRDMSKSYTVPENQLHPDFVAPNYAVNKRSEVFVPSAKAKYFLFKERAWKVGEAPVMRSDLSIRTTALQDDRFLVVDGEAGNAWVFDP